MKEFSAHQELFLDEFIEVHAPVLSDVSLDSLSLDFKKYGPLKFENTKINKVTFSWFTGFSSFLFTEIISSNLDDSRMESTTFENSNVLNSTFRKTSLYKCVFRQTVLENCDFRNTEASLCEFTNCKLQFIDFSYCEFRSCFFKVEDFSATLSNTSFKGCTFLRVPFSKIDLDICNFENCIFVDCELDPYQVKKLSVNNMFVKKWMNQRPTNNTEKVEIKEDKQASVKPKPELAQAPTPAPAPAAPSRPSQPTRFDALEFEGASDEL